MFFLREDNLSLTQTQKLLLARVNALLGGVLLTSDDPATYGEAQRKTYRELLHLRDAEQVRFDADEFCIRYILDGKPQALLLPREQF